MRFKNKNNIAFIFTIKFIWLLCFQQTALAAEVKNPVIHKTHAIAMHGQPKYPANFTHFDYANPDAPRGGVFKQATVSSSGFDSLNPFIVKGVPAAGMAYLGGGYIYDTLLVQSYDEAFTKYGLLAESMEWPDNRSWITFHLRKNAKFHDGHPITAEDVVFTFNLLTEKGHPLYKTYYHNVKTVTALNNHSVKFEFDTKTNRELILIVGQFPILPKHYWETHDFTKTTLEFPLGSGPYKISKVDPGRSIHYERVKDYWGQNVAVNKGQYNFDMLIFDYYREPSVAIEAIKAGKYDLRVENSAKSWATEYNIASVKKGHLIKASITDYTPAAMQSFIFNIRRDKFKDLKVREAIGYAYDFEWQNKTIFYNSYTRIDSYFAGSELAATGTPSKAELVLLDPFKKQLPSELFTKPFTLPKTDGSGNIRNNLRQALRLLKQAGWQIKNKQLVNNKGEPFNFEVLLTQANFERIVLPFQKNLKRMGIEMTIRKIDTQQYIERRNSFDFDMIVSGFPQSTSPGNEQRDYWHSSQANIKGSRNYIGIENPVVDQLISKIIQAPDRKTLIASTQALDRVLLWNHYVIPQYYLNQTRLVYWNKFGMPEQPPKYAVGLNTWWYDSAKAKKLTKQ
ncbi:ABC transporter substrate-binding protein [Endozoicomonas sp. SM1973]|uniref:ABC transporter substrate-binding protein n=1 Tax=Spartinivicinus marinus TaxID=2994442 RepID=A0A853IFE1_9GAMM|nr:extracellular solute-binding protein [Spartinivicinus marinus]MCX4024803.1 extracellular solute-binding protein [Spartinivicinus marinus]NYZ68754.1 ABC transporter substrate-binding protein [Spartinivicinus marinus]